MSEQEPKSNDDLLNSLFTIVLTKLTEQLESGEYKSADMANAIRLLRDNSIQADPSQFDAITNLFEELPFGSEN